MIIFAFRIVLVVMTLKQKWLCSYIILEIMVIYYYQQLIYTSRTIKRHSSIDMSEVAIQQACANNVYTAIEF